MPTLNGVEILKRKYDVPWSLDNWKTKEKMVFIL